MQSSITWGARSFIPLALALLLLSGCDIGQQGTAREPTAAPQATAAPQPTMAGVTANQIANNLDAYIGQTVTVSGEVAAIISPRTFTIGGENYIGGDEVLIVSERPLAELVEGAAETNTWVNGIVQVRGTVQAFDLAALERSLQVDFDEQLLGDWGSRPTIVLDTLALTRRQPQSDAAEPGAAAPAGALRVAAIMENPEAYYNRSLVVGGDVDEILSPTTFTLDEDALTAAGIDNDLLVIAREANAFALDDGWLDDSVVVTGTVRAFVLAEVERDTGIDLDDGLLAEYEQRPVLIADAAAQEVAPVDATVPQAAVAPAVSDVLAAPAGYYSQTLVLIGQVGQLVGAHGFTLADPTPDSLGTGPSDNGLLVLGERGDVITVDDAFANRRVQVRGTLGAFDRAILEQQVGYALDSADFDAWSGRPVLVASSVTTIE